MATVTIYGEKPLKIRLLLQYHMADCSETWYIDFLDPGGGMERAVLHSLYKRRTWVDRDLLFGPLGFGLGKLKEFFFLALLCSLISKCI